MSHTQRLANFVPNPTTFTEIGSITILYRVRVWDWDNAKGKVKIDIFYDNMVDLTDIRDSRRQHRPKHETSVTQLETCLNNKTTSLNRTIKLTN